MRVASFLMPSAWSLCVLTPPSSFLPRHIMTPYFPHARHVLHDAFRGGPMMNDNWQVVDMTNPPTTRREKENDDNDVVSLPSLSLMPTALQHSSPVFLKARSLHHHNVFSTSVYAKYMSYPQFCAWESTIARVVFSYLGDTRRHWIVEVDPIFLYSDSLRDYGTRDAVLQTFWITPSVEVGVPDAVLFSKEFGRTNERSSS